MPGCPLSCPKVKKQLRQIAAKKKNALETKRRQPDEDDEEKVPEDRIPEKKSTQDFDSEEELESEHDFQEQFKGPEKSRSPGSGGKFSRNFGSNLIGKSSKDPNSDRRENRDENEKFLNLDPEFQREIIKDPEESKSSGSGGKSSRNSDLNLSGKSSKDRNSNKRKNRDEEEKVRKDIILGEKATFEDFYSGEKLVLDSDSEFEEEISKDPGELKSPGSGGKFSKNSVSNLSGKSSKNRNSDLRKNRDEEEKFGKDMILVKEPTLTDLYSGEKIVLDSDLEFQGEMSKDPGESKNSGSGERSSRNSRHNLSGKSNFNSAEKYVLKSDDDSQEELSKDPGESKIPGSGGRSSRNSGHNLSGKSSKVQNSEIRKNRDGEEKVQNNILDEEPTSADFYAGKKFELEVDLHSQGRISKVYRESRSPGSGRRSSRNFGQNLLGRSSKDRSSDKRKNRGGSLGNENSDFGGSDGESRVPGKRRRDKNTNSRLSAESSGKSRRDNARAGPSSSSAGEYFSDQGFDSSKHHPRSSEYSLRTMKEEILRRKRKSKQEEVDEYLLNKGMNYFGDLCNCSARCLAQQLWNDPFVRKIFVSAALFAVGIKLCWEMDAWYIPTQ
ncbi:transcriptional regulator ATRX-like [Belonocnema kinseyi]|uniref:transcriptional regulator ATRX-like n=1 Tax=Belonocnema kinseyi TaxID=2817044 RepID=UPI00143DE192|nr:transcriptional regulator ATRX-like [Belonocnema kinseyi]